MSQPKKSTAQRRRADPLSAFATEPMLKRLQEYKKNPVQPEHLGEDWLRLSEAAHEAGVTVATIIKWADSGELARRQSKSGWRYHREAVRASARIYWLTVRFHRAVPPDWLQSEYKTTRSDCRRSVSPSRAAPIFRELNSCPRIPLPR